MTNNSGTSDPLDYAIIGGGVSGLYSAWRLLTDSTTKPSVAVFESSDRVGGRLLTWSPYPNDAGLRAELGGMRFLKNQTLVWNLLDKILPGKKTDFYVTGSGLRWYLRGQGMASGDVPTATTRYFLRSEEQHKSPSALLEQVIDKVLDSDKNLDVLKKYFPDRTPPRPKTREEWDKVKNSLTYRNKPLREHGFWNVIADMVSTEAYHYIVDAFGYYTLALNWNAAEAIQNVSLEFAGEPKYYTLKGGYETLPKTLADLVTKANGKINLKHELISFEEKNGLFELAIESGGTTRTVTARKVILALPRRSLERISPSPTFDVRRNRKLSQLLDSVRAYPAFKLFLFYQKRWWDPEVHGSSDQKTVLRGRSVSDMPIRQTYYMPPDDYTTKDYGLIMASYDDGQAVDFWQGLEPRAGSSATETAAEEQSEGLLALLKALGVSSTDSPSKPPMMHDATPEMVRHAREQLALLHGKKFDDVPPPVYAAYADWSLDPFGGGWHFWAPQVNVQQAMTDIKQPLGNGTQVFVVGEAYSGIQGWVEGTLTATEKMLQDRIKLPEPEWLKNTKYYLGW